MKTKTTIHCLGSALTIAALLLPVLGMQALHAATVTYIVQPTGAKASSSNLGRNAVDTIDGGGLSDATTVETGDPVPGTWTTHGNVAGNVGDATMWLSINTTQGGGEGAEWIMFDLGANYILTGLHVWNYNEAAGGATGNGIKDMTVKFATSSSGYDAGSEGDASWGSGVSTTLAQASGLTTYDGETINVDQIVARYVLFDTVNTHFTGYNRTGLSEVRFIAIPEPSSTALLGLGALGLMLRRKRS